MRYYKDMKKRYVLILVILALILGALIASIVFDQKFKNNPKVMLEKVASHYPKNVDKSSAQWFIMKNFMGEWEQMMLIFGYEDDKGVCDFMLAITKETDPEREFRCKDVN